MPQRLQTQLGNSYLKAVCRATNFLQMRDINWLDELTLKTKVFSCMVTYRFRRWWYRAGLELIFPSGSFVFPILFEARTESTVYTLFTGQADAHNHPLKLKSEIASYGVLIVPQLTHATKQRWLLPSLSCAARLNKWPTSCWAGNQATYVLKLILHAIGKHHRFLSGALARIEHVSPGTGSHSQ